MQLKLKNLNQAQNETKLKIIDIHLKFDKPFRVSKPESSDLLSNHSIFCT